jgi:hypothetical protein
VVPTMMVYPTLPSAVRADAQRPAGHASGLMSQVLWCAISHAPTTDPWRIYPVSMHNIIRPTNGARHRYPHIVSLVWFISLCDMVRLAYMADSWRVRGLVVRPDWPSAVAAWHIVPFFHDRVRNRCGLTKEVKPLISILQFAVNNGGSALRDTQLQGSS